MFGVSFTNPAMLHALWAAALPLLIHLLNRRRSVTVAFSNVALLQTLQQDRMRRVRMKQWLLMAIRTLLIAALVLAFARPTVRQGSFGGGHGETHAVMLVDRSLSMQYTADGKTLLDHARDRVEEAIALFDARDETVLLPYDDRVTPTNPATPDALRLTLKSVDASFRGSDAAPAIDAARRILRESTSLNRELYVFSDLTTNGWSHLRDPYDGFEGTSVFVLPTPDVDGPNVSIRSIRPEGILLAVGTAATLIVDLENTSPEAVIELPVHVYADDQRIGQKVVHLAAGATARVTFRYTPDRGGARVFRAEIPDDAFGPDNTLATVVHIPDRIRVGLIGTEDDTYYLREALGSGAATSLEVTTLTAGSSGSEQYERLDLIVLANVRRLGRGEVAAIQKRVAAGAGLLIVMGEGLDVRLYNEQILPALCPATITGISGRRSDRNGFLQFDTSGLDHPTLARLIGQDLKGPRFYLTYAVQPGEDTRVVAAYGSGTPGLLEHALGNGRVMLLTSHTDLEWSDLPVTGFFAPFLHRAVRYLSTGAYGAADVTVGRRLMLPVKQLASREAVVQPPTGPVSNVWAQQLGGRPHWVIEEVDQPGVWQIYAGERVVDRFAARIDSRESDTERVAAAAVEALFPGADVVFVAPGDSLAHVVGAYRYGAELWRYFLVAGLICLAIELALLSGETRARS